MQLTAPTLPFAHPTDEALARALIEEVLQQAREEKAARELCERLEQEKRVEEKVLTFDL